MIPALADHLWQSTLFAAVAGLMTLALRGNRAQVRYCLWLAASVKFLVPFSILVTVGSHFGWRSAAAIAPSNVPLLIEPFTQATPLAIAPAIAHSSMNPIPILLYSVWAVGFLFVVSSWWRRWWQIRGAVRAASLLHLPVGVRVLSSPAFFEPGVFGIFRPILLLPAGITDQLSAPQLRAIVAHELCHIRRRDNLATAIHMLVEAVFWFHPLVWWLGARLMQERENACDEEVLRMGNDPQAYAESILKICELYLESPLECVAGVTGANLKGRIEAIMNNRSTLKLNFAKKAVLAAAGILAVAIPVSFGVMNAPLLRAQADPNQRFEVATVRRVDISNTATGGVPAFFPTGGIGTSDPTHIAYRGVWLENSVAEAFGVRSEDVSGPDWLTKERYDIVANIPEGATKEQFNVMLGNLLRDRFHLRFHIESKIVPAYALRVGKNGPKFKETVPHDDAKIPSERIDAQGYPVPLPGFKGILSLPHDGQIFIVGQDVPIADLARMLEHNGPRRPDDRPVIDETGLTAHYDFKIHFEYIRRPATDGGVASDPAPSVLAAVEEQLGLKLESTTTSIPQLSIESIDREPTDN